MEHNVRRQRGMEAILVYLKAEFRDRDVSQFPEQTIKVRGGSAQVLHEVTFYPQFLDDHADREVQQVKEWGLVSYMKQAGATPIWVRSGGLST
jgi:hypothetical protein